MWQATPSTFGSSKPSTTILSFGPSRWKRVLTDPVVPRSGRLNIHSPKRRTIAKTPAPTIRPNFRMSPLVIVYGNPTRGTCAGRHDVTGSYVGIK